MHPYRELTVTVRLGTLLVFAIYMVSVDEAPHNRGCIPHAEDPENVQLALLTATVKLFLNRPQSCQAVVQKILTQATQVRDRL